MLAGLVTSIPSPSRAEVHLGPFPLRGYALCIILGVVASVIIGERRFRRMGYHAGVVSDIAIWAVPFGLVGARLYHVATDPELYFEGHGEHWYRSFFIWDGGLGIWGGIALGAVGALIGCRQYHVRFSHLADALAVGIPVAQAVGRWGNWFNQELYGKPSGLPWAVRIDAAHRLPQYANVATYQPTYLYECIWDLGTAGFVLLAERYKWFGRLSAGRAFALYVAVYCVGRGWIEYLRIDHANRYLGLRLNDYTSLIIFLLAVGFMIRVRGRGPDVAEVQADGEETPAAVAATAVEPGSFVAAATSPSATTPTTGGVPHAPFTFGRSDPDPDEERFASPTVHEPAPLPAELDPVDAPVGDQPPVTEPAADASTDVLPADLEPIAADEPIVADEPSAPADEPAAPAEESEPPTLDEPRSDELSAAEVAPATSGADKSEAGDAEARDAEARDAEAGPGEVPAPGDVTARPDAEETPEPVASADPEVAPVGEDDGVPDEDVPDEDLNPIERLRRRSAAQQ